MACMSQIIAFFEMATAESVKYTMKRVLVLPLYGIGDVLMSTPAVRNLKEQLNVEITYLHMFKTTRDILLSNPCIKENIHFPFLQAGKLDILRFMLRFRKKSDIAINFYPSNRRDYNLASFVTASPLRIGHRYVRRDWQELNFLKNRTVKEDDSLHNVEEDLRLLDFCGIREKKKYAMEIHLTEEEKRFARQWLKERKIERKFLIGMHPGTSTFKNHGMKRWSEASFADLIGRICLERSESVVLLFGGPEEQSLRQTIISSVRVREKIFPVDSLPIRLAAAVMGECGLFVSNDSGPMHMAAASGVPTVAIFGPTNPVWLRPWGVKHRVVREDSACRPCFRYSPRPMECIEKRDYACIRGISVEQVFAACKELMKDQN
jgi:heptosyltransferase-2